MLFMRWGGGHLQGVLFLGSYFKCRIGIVQNLFILIEDDKVQMMVRKNNPLRIWLNSFNLNQDCILVILHNLGHLNNEHLFFFCPR